MLKMLTLAAASLVATAAYSAAFGPIADKPSSDGYFTGYVEVTNGFGTTSAGTMTIRASQIDYQNGTANKIAIIPANNAYNWEGTGPKPGMACRFRTSGNSANAGSAGALVVGTGTVLDCVASSGNGGQRREAPAVLTYDAD